MIYHIEYKDGDSDRENATAHTLASTTASMSVAAAPSLHLSISLTLSAIVSLLSTQLLAASSNSLAVSFGH